MSEFENVACKVLGVILFFVMCHISISVNGMYLFNTRSGPIPVRIY